MSAEIPRTGVPRDEDKSGYPAAGDMPDHDVSEVETAAVAPSDDDPRAAITAVVAIVGALLIFIIVIGLQAWYYGAEETERATKVYSRTPEELTRLRASQREQLNSYRWVDRDQGVVSIPIGQAMDLVVREQGEAPRRAASEERP